MGLLKFILSKIPGKVPSINSMDPSTFSWNIRDGILFGLKENENGVKEVVIINGDPSIDGEDGLTPFIGENGNWWIGDLDTGVQAAGENGVNPEGGTTGQALTKASDNDFDYLWKDITADKHFIFNQGIPSTQWNISHNLNKIPSVTIVDTSGNEIEGEIIHINNNNVTLNFSAAFAGYVLLN
ncbi:MAG: hypothetical protein K0B15_11800 [Lentimicrobium sp.]|nr:hypothetical protein [Lentimicrobium sp.]